MARRFLLAWTILLLHVAAASALDAVGTIRSIDPQRGVLVVFAGGQDRTLTADPNVRVLGRDGNPLPGGLGSPEFKPDVQVSVTVDPGPGGRIALRMIRLGAAGQPGAGRPMPQQPGAGGPARGRGWQNGPAPTPRATIGLKPLSEMTATDDYKGEDGGLYGGGRNVPPKAHADAAKQESSEITPRDRSGKPAADGKIVLVSISMSNATQEFSTFKRIADADEAKSPQLTIVDCAQGGRTMEAWARPEADAWTVAEQRLGSAGVSAEQVQIAWVKLANGGPSGELNEHGKYLYDDTLTVLTLLKQRFPNLKVAYLGSRIYGGYANTRLNPEPYAYEGAFVVRRLIRDQAEGAEALSFASSSAKVPLLLWGPYLWADGTTPRKADGLVWDPADLADDGTHPTPAGRRKVAGLLLDFFKNDANAKSWFVVGRGN